MRNLRSGGTSLRILLTFIISVAPALVSLPILMCSALMGLA